MASAKNKQFDIPTFSIYGLPRNSDYEFELLDQHFFNQCEWMRHLSPSQLGIEAIYWCDTPPLTLHANSDILLNVKDSADHFNLYQSLRKTSKKDDASSLSELPFSKKRKRK